MKRKNKKFLKKNSNSLNKLSLFQKNDGKFSKKCPLSTKDAPIIDYKNISLLKKYVSDNGKIISSKITSVSFNKQKKLNREIKKAKILGLLQNGYSNRIQTHRCLFLQFSRYRSFSILPKKKVYRNCG